MKYFQEFLSDQNVHITLSRDEIYQNNNKDSYQTNFYK